MPHSSDPSGLVVDVRAWIDASYPMAVVRRFFALELLDRSFGLAAQAFVAMLPIVLVFITVVLQANPVVIADQVGDRFALDRPARSAIQVLFEAPASVRTISGLAVFMSLLSAYSLSRRLSRVYASILQLEPLARSQVWRGLVWIGLQVVLFVAASALRGVRRDSGALIATLAVIALLATWFLADVAGLRLLVPKVPRRVLIPTAVIAGVGRFGFAVWGTIYMPRALTDQALQYGPIGVTFAIFTYILAGVFVYVGAPLLVSTWELWRAERRAVPSASE